LCVGFHDAVLFLALGEGQSVSPFLLLPKFFLVYCVLFEIVVVRNVVLFVKLAHFVLNFFEFSIELEVLREGGAATEAEDAEGQDQEHREELESYV